MARPEAAEEHHSVVGECLSMQREGGTRILLPVAWLAYQHVIAMAYRPKTRPSGTALPRCAAGYAARSAC